MLKVLPGTIGNLITWKGAKADCCEFEWIGLKDSGIAGCAFSSSSCDSSLQSFILIVAATFSFITLLPLLLIVGLIFLQASFITETEPLL